MHFLKLLAFILSFSSVANAVPIRGQLEKAQLENLASDPTCGATVEARVYWDSDDNLFRLCDGSSWLSVANLSNKISDFAAVTSAELSGKVSDETGTGLFVLNNGPTLIAPILGTPASGTLTNTTGFPVANLAGAGSGVLTFLATPSSANFFSMISNETGSGLVMGNVSPTIQTAVMDDYVVINEESVPGTAASNTVRLYAKSDGLLYSKDDVGTETALGGGGGSGSGEINVITNPSAATATTGWTDGTNHTTTRVTSSSPLDPITATAFQCAASAGTAATNQANGCYYSISTMPAALRNRKLKIEFYFTTPAAADVWNVSLFDSGGTRMVLSTDSSSATILPASTTGKFTAYFDSTSSTSYRLNFVKTTHSGANNLLFTSVVVGPGIMPQGAAIGSWNSFTPSITASGGGTVSIGSGGGAVSSGQWRRVGDTMEIAVEWKFGTSSASFGTSGQYRFALPSGYSINASALTGSNGTVLGHGMLVDDSASDNFGLTFLYDGSANIIAYIEESVTGALLGTTSPVTLAASDGIRFRMTVPISEWAGSGTVNIASNEPMYACNDGSAGTSAGAAYTTGSVANQAGCQFVAVASTTADSATTYKVSFPYPINPLSPYIEVTQDGGVTWTVQPSVVTLPRAIHSNSIYGMSVLPNDSTSVLVQFGNKGRTPYNSGTTLGQNGETWTSIGASATYKWRVVAVRAGQAVGFGEVAQSASGLVKSAGQLLGTNTNDVAATGYVGEYKENVRSSSQSLTTATTYYIDSGGDSSPVGITLGPGDWDITGVVFVTTGGGTLMTDIQAWIGDGSGSSGQITYANSVRQLINWTAGGYCTMTLPTWRVSLSAQKTYYLKANVTFTVNSAAATGTIRARRVR